MNKLILHIPHSAISIPIKEGFIINQDEIDNEILNLTDWHTEDLYNSENCEKIIFNYSRIFCDPERFDDDSREPMAKVGMGVLYTTTDEGKVMRVITPEIREVILKDFYYKHHTRLYNAVKNHLKQNNKAFILDCHSFPDLPMKRNSDKSTPRPNFCIGTDSFHTSEKLIDLSVDFFNKRNLSYKINSPFKGTIVPMAYYKKNKNVTSIMLEVNRKLYLKTGTNQKSEHYNETKKIVLDYIELLKKQL